MRFPISLAAATVATALALPSAHAAPINSCYTTTRYSYVASCTFVPSTATLAFYCSTYSGGTGTITIVQHVFSNTQPCSTYRVVTVVPGVLVGVRLNQSNTTGFIEGGANSQLR